MVDILQLRPIICERRGAPDELAPYEGSLEDGWDLLVKPGESQDGLRIQEVQDLSNLSLCLRKVRSYFKRSFCPKLKRALAGLAGYVLTIDAAVSGCGSEPCRPASKTQTCHKTLFRNFSNNLKDLNGIKSNYPAFWTNCAIISEKIHLSALAER